MHKWNSVHLNYVLLYLTGAVLSLSKVLTLLSHFLDSWSGLDLPPIHNMLTFIQNILLGGLVRDLYYYRGQVSVWKEGGSQPQV